MSVLNVQVRDTLQYTISSTTDDTGLVQFRILWTIPDYMNVVREMKHPQSIMSRDAVNIGPNYLCKLLYYPENQAKTGSSIYIGKNLHGTNIRVYYRAAVLKKDGEEMHQMSFSKIHEVGNGIGFGTWLPIFSEENFEDLLNNESLHILVEGTVWKNELKLQAPPGLGNLKNVAAAEIPSLFQNKSHSEVILSVGEKEFHVHKNILSSASPVFQEMFKAQTENIIPISDISPDVFQQFLYFIYNRFWIAGMDTSLPDLFRVAHKYKVAYLKLICERKMIMKMEISNAVEFLKISDELCAAELKEHALSFIIENRKAVSGEESWKKFSSKPSELLASLCSRLMVMDF